MKNLISTIAYCVLFSIARSNAQTPGAIEQVESVQQRRQLDSAANSQQEGENAPELFPGESSDVGPQSVLRFKPRKTWFEAFADVQYFYTDNMFLTENNEQSSDVLVSSAQFALAPTPPAALGGGQLAPRLGYRHQWFDYGLAGGTVNHSTFKLNEFDFNAQTAFAYGQWTHGNWVVDAGFDFTRLMDTAKYDEFYKEYVPHWGVQRLFPLSAAGALALGYAGDYRFTDATVPFFVASDFNDRTDHSLFAAYIATLCKHAVVQPFYRFKYTHFTTGADRSDYLNSFGVAVHYFFTPQISLRAFVNYDIRDSSNSAVPDYNKLDTGGGVNLLVKF